jgi:hypothetical protein
LPGTLLIAQCVPIYTRNILQLFGDMKVAHVQKLKVTTER